MLHGLAASAGRINATPCRCHDHGLALGQAFGAVGAVFECAARLGDAVNPGLELGGDAKVVERGANDHHVCCQELAHELFGHGVFTLLHFCQTIGLAGAGGHCVHREMVGGVDSQVQVSDLRAWVAGLPGFHDLGRELTRNGSIASDG